MAYDGGMLLHRSKLYILIHSLGFIVIITVIGTQPNGYRGHVHLAEKKKREKEEENKRHGHITLFIFFIFFKF